MTGSLLDRIRTLLRADAHGLVESLEERSLLLKQNVREAELELARKRARVDALVDEEKQLRDALARGQSELASLDADVQLALEGGEDDLARFALRKWLPLRSRTRALEDDVQRRAEERQALEAKLRDQETRFEALRARVRTELAREVETPDGVEDWFGPPEVADEEVELELMRRRAGGAS